MNLLLLSNTRRYGPLCGPTSSSCGGLPRLVCKDVVTLNVLAMSQPATESSTSSPILTFLSVRSSTRTGAVFVLDKWEFVRWRGEGVEDGESGIDAGIELDELEKVML